MSLQFYNTMSRRKEDFKPIKEGKVGIYNCGPTVYNYPHVGNLRAFIFADLLKRYLKFKGYKVTQVMNLTDVDDKIIKKCAETGTSIREYTETYKQAFFNDIKKLNIEDADHYPAATDHIREMVDLVKKLLDKGLAYKAEDGNIFYKISAFENYGKLQRLDMSQMRSGDRVDDDEYEKESANDFALWKAYKDGDGEVSWDTPLGKGRPGWHIECSAMSMKYLGETFDIHTGGVDNLFPHHENEIAQSEGATGKRFVNYWLHCEHLLWNNTKMSKSLGNIIYIDGLMEKGYSPAAIRYALLTTHYRQKLNFSLTLLDEAEKSIKKFNDFIYRLNNIKTANISIEQSNFWDEYKAKKNKKGRKIYFGHGKVYLDPREIPEHLKSLEYAFSIALDNDLNISYAMAVIFDTMRSINVRLPEEIIFPQDYINDIFEAFKKIDEVLGVIFFSENKKIDIDEAFIISKIEERKEARADKDWAKADAIRDELDAMGVELLDRKDGTGYKIKN